MYEFFTLGNARLMIAVNHWAASDPAVYMFLLLMTDKVSDVLTLATFALLWFWPEPKEREYLLAHPDAPRSWVQQLRLRWRMALSREESRAQFLVLGFAGVLGYVTARMIAFEIDASRPFATVLPIRSGVPGAFEDLRTFGSFPSDHAVMLAAIPTALLFWDRSLAYLWVCLSVVLVFSRVAVGFHFPVDMIGGGLIGATYAYTGLSLFRRRGKFARTVLNIARGFDLRSAPYCYILYSLALLGAIEFAMHFEHVLQALFTVRSEVLHRFARGGN